MNSLIGQKFCRLTVVEYVLGSKYRCVCDCGNEVTTYTYSLKHRLTRSCGCLRKEVVTKKATKHNGSTEPLYHVLNSMHQRCENPKNRNYVWYGARGVTVCDEWSLSNYALFREWAESTGYKPGLTIDRIDPEGVYTPNNCRWITIQEQQRNRRKNKRTAI